MKKVKVITGSKGDFEKELNETISGDVDYEYVINYLNPVVMCDTLVVFSAIIEYIS